MSRRRPSSTALAATVKARRVPQQERSRARLEVILKTAQRLFGRNGAASMREIAAEAGISIASLYQYYPDQAAILRALSVDFYTRMRGRLEHALSNVRSVDEFAMFSDAMIDALVDDLGRSRSHLNFWSALQAHEVLRALDMRDALDLARLVEARFVAIAPGVDRDRVRDLCAFSGTMAGAVARQSFAMPHHEADALVREFKCLIRMRIDALVAGR